MHLLVFTTFPPKIFGYVYVLHHTFIFDESTPVSGGVQVDQTNHGAIFEFDYFSILGWSQLICLKKSTQYEVWFFNFCGFGLCFLCARKPFEDIKIGF